MKRISTLLICAIIVIAIIFTGCSRDYSSWRLVYCESIGSSDVQANPDKDPFFYVPSDWVCSRIGDYIFFASYVITNTKDIIKEDGELYLIGWLNKNDHESYTVRNLFDYIAVPSDSAVYGVGVGNGAIYGREKYIVGTQTQEKNYVSLKSTKFYELKLIDWQDNCGKDLMKLIAQSFYAGQ